MRPAPRPTARVRATVLLLAVLSLAGCREKERATPDTQGAGVRRYSVRGEVVQLPPPAAGTRKVSIRHQAIDDFVNQSGATVGMAAMMMQFDVAPQVALDDVRVGDKVEFQLAVGWSPPLLRIDALRKLPQDTALEFRPARPPGGGGAERPAR